MLQEYKVVIASNDYGLELEPYIAVNHISAAGKLSFEKDEKKIIEFAQACVNKLLSANHNAIADAPILRVDIMRLQNGEWVVNEFESLEALTDKRDITGSQESRTATYLGNFWKLDIARMVA